jgi:uncharacterized protein (TIGR00251 family)
MAAGEQPWTPVSDGLRVRLRLTPKSSRDDISGIEATAEGPALKARVRAVPEDGKANAAASELLARWLGVAKSTVTLAAGAKSRIKTLHVAGSPDDLALRLTAKLKTS